MCHPDFCRRTLHPTLLIQIRTFSHISFIVLDVLATLGPLLSPQSVFTILACRNYYCYLAVCVIPHQGVRRRRPDTPAPPSRATVSRQAIFYISTLSEVLFTAVAFSLRCYWLERELIKRVESFLNSKWQICSPVEPGLFGCLWYCRDDWMETKGLCMLGKKYVWNNQYCVHALCIYWIWICLQLGSLQTNKKTVNRSPQPEQRGHNRIENVGIL